MSYRLLNDFEKNLLELSGFYDMKYLVVRPISYQLPGIFPPFIIPHGFLSDGCSDPLPSSDEDILLCIVHDFLYATHGNSVGADITRAEADASLKMLRYFGIRFTFPADQLAHIAWNFSYRRGVVRLLSDLSQPNLAGFSVVVDKFRGPNTSPVTSVRACTPCDSRKYKMLE